MKKIIKTVLIVAGILIILAGILIGSMIYVTRYKISPIDNSISPDKTHEVRFQAVGEPYWPFGASPGRLVLLDGKHEIVKVDFEVSNDGGWLSEYNWTPTWYDDRVEVLLYGEEQGDELWILYFDGVTDTRHPNTKYGKEIVYPTEDPAESQNSVKPNPAEEISEPEPDPYMLRVEEGYSAVYNTLYEEGFTDFEVIYGAKESSSRCILYETESTVHYLAYNRESKNGKCGLYVRCQVKKDEDGSWSYENASIENTYAYVYETDQVISSEKKSWQDIGTELYQQVTGEY